MIPRCDFLWFRTMHSEFIIYNYTFSYHMIYETCASKPSPSSIITIRCWWGLLAGLEASPNHPTSPTNCHVTERFKSCGTDLGICRLAWLLRGEGLGIGWMLGLKSWFFFGLLLLYRYTGWSPGEIWKQEFCRLSGVNLGHEVFYVLDLVIS